jgi:hypothetical protein
LSKFTSPEQRSKLATNIMEDSELSEHKEWSMSSPTILGPEEIDDIHVVAPIVAVHEANHAVSKRSVYAGCSVLDPSTSWGEQEVPYLTGRLGFTG